MTVTASLRTTVKQRLVDVFTDALKALDGASVRVSYGQFKDSPREGVVLHDIRTTDETLDAMTGASSRKPSRDKFTVEGIIGARQIGQSCLAGEQRVEAIYNLLKNATIDPTVAGPVLYGEGNYPAITGLVSAWVRPGDLLSDASPEGWQSTLEFFGDVETRLT